MADDRLADLRLTPAQGRVLSYLRQGAGPLWRSSLPGAGILADVAIFDEAHFITRASYLEPQVYAEGMRHVLINGQLALDDGQATGILVGRVLER